MRACFVLWDLGRSGGVQAVLDHARRLDAADGFEVDVVTCRGRPGERAAPGVRLRTLAEAASRPYDLVLATWWETVAPVLELPARRRALFVQNLEQRYYRQWEGSDRLAASAVLALPLDTIATAAWMRDLLAELKPEAHHGLARYGIDKGVFAPRDRPAHDGPLRVLVEGQPSIWWKGVGEAVAAVRAMSEPAELTVVALDPSHANALGADRVVGDLDVRGMAGLYAETDVLVKLARFEGFGLAPLEAFHLGVPCVVSPYTGHEEYVVHGENGLVAGFDDPAAVTRWLDLLARDGDLLARLGRGALATAQRWPSPQDSTDELAAAMEALMGAPPVRAEAGLAAVLRAVRVEAELSRERGSSPGALAGERAKVFELTLSRAECAELLEDARRRLDETTASRAYRAAVAARRLLHAARR